MEPLLWNSLEKGWPNSNGMPGASRRLPATFKYKVICRNNCYCIAPLMTPSSQRDEENFHLGCVSLLSDRSHLGFQVYLLLNLSMWIYQPTPAITDRSSSSTGDCRCSTLLVVGSPNDALCILMYTSVIHICNTHCNTHEHERRPRRGTGNSSVAQEPYQPSSVP